MTERNEAGDAVNLIYQVDDKNIDKMEKIPYSVVKWMPYSVSN